jgi:type IX secretion system PorP/SprF family membrane protein
MKPKQVLIILTLLFSGDCFWAQHQNVYSNYILNASLLNPAATGKDEALDINFYSRKQWQGFSGGPLTNAVSVNSMIKKPAANIGLLFSDDRIGFSTNQIAGINYAYRIKFRKIKLAFGIQGSFQSLTTNLNKLTRVNEIDQVVTQNQQRQTGVNLGSGIFLHSNRFFAGIAMPYLSSLTNFNYRTTPLYVHCGYIQKIRSGKDLVKPSFLIRRISGLPVSYDLNLTYFMLSKYGIGLSYRSNSAIVALAEFILTDQFKVGYCYDYSTTALSQYQTGSHELSLRYLFGKKLNMNNPRALNF